MRIKSNWTAFVILEMFHVKYIIQGPVGRYDFGFFWNINTGKQILPCVTETQRYGCIRGSVGRVQTPRSTTLGCEKSYNG